MLHPSAGDGPTVSVIVPVRESEMLRTCLEALDQQDYPRGLVQVIVADNNAVPSIDWVSREFPSVSVVVVPEPGSYGARNRALNEATGEVVAFTDADCRPSPQWITEAVAQLQLGADAVGGRIVMESSQPGRLHPIEAYEVVHGLPQAQYVEKHGWAATANMVTSRRVLEEIGDFRSDLKSGGDAEWGRRLSLSGRAMVYAPTAVVFHPARRTFGEYWKKLKRVHRGRRDQELGGGVPRDDRRLRPGALKPPIGAVARARNSTQLDSPGKQFAYIVGSFYVRYAGAIARYMAVTGSRGRQLGDSTGERNTGRSGWVRE